MSTQPPQPAKPAEVDPAETLAELNISSRHPTALKLAPLWASVLRAIACGNDIQVACRISRVPRQTFYSWLRFGRGYTERDVFVPPHEPFTEFVAAYDEARAAPVADAWEALTNSAREGNVQAALAVIERRSAQQTATDRSKLAKAQRNGQILRNRLTRKEIDAADVTLELARTNLALAQKKLAGEHVEQHAILTPDDPRWRALQVQHLGGERQGVNDAPTGPDSPDDPVASE